MRWKTIAFLVVAILAACGDRALTVHGSFTWLGSTCVDILTFFDETGAQIAVLQAHIDERFYDPSTPGTGEPACSLFGSYSVELPPAESYEVRVGDDYEAVRTRTELEDSPNWVVYAFEA